MALGLGGVLPANQPWLDSVGFIAGGPWVSFGRF